MLSRSMSIMERRSCHATPPSAVRASCALGGGEPAAASLSSPAADATYRRMGGQRLMPLGCVWAIERVGVSADDRYQRSRRIRRKDEFAKMVVHDPLQDATYHPLLVHGYGHVLLLHARAGVLVHGPVSLLGRAGEVAGALQLPVSVQSTVI